MVTYNLTTLKEIADVIGFAYELDPASKITYFYIKCVDADAYYLRHAESKFAEKIASIQGIDINTVPPEGEPVDQ